MACKQFGGVFFRPIPQSTQDRKGVSHAVRPPVAEAAHLRGVENTGEAGLTPMGC